MKSLQAFDLDLRGRLIALAMAPVLLFAIVWGGYLIQQRGSDLRTQLQQRAQLLSRQLAIAADYGIFSRNRVALEQLTQSVAREQNVEAATIYSGDLEVLASSGVGATKGPLPTPGIRNLFVQSAATGHTPVSTESATWMAFLEPIRSPSLVVEDVDLASDSVSTKVRGYAVVEVSTSTIAQELLNFVKTVLALLIGVSATGWYMAQRISTRITGRMQDVANAAQRIGAGEPGVRLRPSNIAVFDRLSRDLNHMAFQLEDSRSGLELRVDHATIALREQRDAAEAANAAKTRFLAAASHDLRQPMHALSMLLAALKGEQSEHQRQLLLNRVEATSEAMGGLLDALLDISRLDAGGVRVNTDVIELKPLLWRLRDTYEGLADNKNIELVVKPTSLRVVSDPILLERILGNFLSNAIRYTPNGGRVMLAVRKRGMHAVLQVRDNGPGIAPAYQESIFQEFVQVHNPQRDRSQGLGLGLAIVDRLARLLGHTLKLRSCLAHGAIFSVAVPIAEPILTANAALPLGGDLSSQEATTASQGSLLHRLPILVVEDDPLVRESYLHLLQMWDADVRTFATAQSAMDQLQVNAWRPELLITDQRLGDGVFGLDLIARVAQIVGHRLPSILITGDTENQDLRDIDPSSVVVLFKPVRPIVLKQALTRLRADNSLRVQ